MRASLLVIMSVALWFGAFQGFASWPGYGDSILMAALIGNAALVMVAKQSQR